jgi:hypothetical protein
MEEELGLVQSTRLTSTPIAVPTTRFATTTPVVRSMDTEEPATMGKNNDPHKLIVDLDFLTETRVVVLFIL